MLAVRTDCPVDSTRSANVRSFPGPVPMERMNRTWTDAASGKSQKFSFFMSVSVTALLSLSLRPGR